MVILAFAALLALACALDGVKWWQRLMDKGVERMTNEKRPSGMGSRQSAKEICANRIITKKGDVRNEKLN